MGDEVIAYDLDNIKTNGRFIKYGNNMRYPYVILCEDNVIREFIHIELKK